MSDAVSVNQSWTSVSRMLQDEPVFTIAGLAMLLLVFPTLLLFAVETRTLNGQNLWIKPLKFELSLAMFFLTLAFFARFLPEGLTTRTDYQIFAAIVVVCAAVEMIWILSAAAFGTASHFNTNPAMASIYGLMGMIAVVLTSATLVYGAIILRSGGSALETAIGLSLIITFVLTIVVAFRLAGNEGHLVGESFSGQVLPILGWSREVGDLRVPHFFATHAMQILPLTVFAIALVAGEWMTRTTAIGLGVCYAIFTLFIFLQALNARPFIA